MNGHTAVNAETVKRAYQIASGFFAAGMDRDDLAQEALIGALAARRTYRPDAGCPFSAFEHGCMRRRVLDAVNRSRTVGRGSGVTAGELTEEHPGPQSVPDLAEHRAELHRLLAALPALTLTERRAVVGFAVGCTYKELGRKKEVDNALFRARRKLAA